MKWRRPKKVWWEVVKSGDADHLRYGVHVRPCHDGSAEVNAARVADYYTGVNAHGILLMPWMKLLCR
jgi:hypothetical protein